jgi:hypothetical protein
VADVHTCVYDVNLLERVGLDIELPIILHAIGLGKLYDEPRSGWHLLTFEYLITFDSFVRHRKSYVFFPLFRRRYECAYPQFSKHMDFFSSRLLESPTIVNFDRLEFSDEISRKSSRIRFSDIHNPTLRFLHRLLSFTLFLMRELCSISVVEFRCLYATVLRIKYNLVAHIINYFKEICTVSGPIECTSLVTRIVLNLGCEEMANVSYISGDVPILGLSHFVHAHILHKELDRSISMLYEGGSKVLWLPNSALALHSCEHLTL